MNPEDDPEYWINMGYSLAQQGKPDKAQKYYEKALEIDPDNVAALNNLAIILSDQGKEDEALKYLKYTTEIYPDSVEAWINLGVSYMDKGDLDEAISVLIKQKISIRGMLHYGTIEDTLLENKTSLGKQFRIMIRH